MATSLVDSPAAATNGQAPPPDGTSGAGTQPPVGAPSAGAPAPVGSGRNCLKCAAPLQEGQDWCLQCGAGARGSLGTPGWRSGAVALAAVAVLVLGAAAAAVAALGKSTPKAPVVTTTVAQASPSAPTSTAPASTPSTTTPAPGAVAKAKATLPLGSVKPPKIPLTAVTPKAFERATARTPSTEGKASTPTSTSTTTTPSSPSGSSTTGEESQQSAILLDTNAASTYNPYNYPASWFGDPSLAIDGDSSTAWTAQVNPATAPALAEGLLIDLKTKQTVSVLQLVTSTPGMTVQVYGAVGHTLPESITDPAWVPLSAFKVAKKKHLRLKLRDSKKAFTFIVLWISKAPQSAIGTATAPGHVDVNEVELFPTS